MQLLLKDLILTNIFKMLGFFFDTAISCYIYSKAKKNLQAILKNIGLISLFCCISLNAPPLSDVRDLAVMIFDFCSYD